MIPIATARINGRARRRRRSRERTIPLASITGSRCWAPTSGQSSRRPHPRGGPWTPSSACSRRSKPVEVSAPLCRCPLAHFTSRSSHRAAHARPAKRPFALLRSSPVSVTLRVLPDEQRGIRFRLASIGRPVPGAGAVGRRSAAGAPAGARARQEAPVTPRAGTGSLAKGKKDYDKRETIRAPRSRSRDACGRQIPALRTGGAETMNLEPSAAELMADGESPRLLSFVLRPSRVLRPSKLLRRFSARTRDFGPGPDHGPGTDRAPRTKDVAITFSLSVRSSANG